MLDIEREQDIERLRQVARLQKSQLEHLIAALARKGAELEKLKGGSGELQMVLKLLEEAQQVAAKLDVPTAPTELEPKTRRDSQRGHGPTEQSNLPRVPLVCELDEADRACPECGDRLKPLAGEAERSELIDVVELKYQVVEVARQKYVCGCGGTVETASGPRARRRGRPLLAALRDQGRLRQVRRPPAVGAAGPTDGAPRPQRHVADAVGPMLGRDGVAGADVRCDLHATSGEPRRRRRSDGLAGSRGHISAAVADVVRNRARARV